MPFSNGRFIAPRKALPKQQNGALVVVWLAFRLISAELMVARGDWDRVISVFREMLGENPAQRVDYNEDGSRKRYSQMADEIENWRSEWRAR